MAQQSSGFWTSLPGIITAIATLISAITAAYIAVQKYGSDDDSEVVNTPPVVVEQPQQQTNTQNQTTGAVTTFHPSSGLVSKNIQNIKKLQQDKINTAAISQLQARSLVECQYFPTVNTVKSLMSWSNYYHQKIIDANGVRNDSSIRACKKTVAYRAQAHCKAPADIAVRQALFETLSLCNGVGVSWKAAVPQ